MIRVVPFIDEYYVDVAKLLFDNKNAFSDDYQGITKENIIKKIEAIKLNLFIGLDDDKFIGLFYAYDFYTDEATKRAHSCYINGAAIRKVSPLKTRKALELYINILYNYYGIVKIKALVEIRPNFKKRLSKKGLTKKIYISPTTKILRYLRFKEEAYLKGETFKNGQLKDYLQFGRINDTFLRNLNMKGS